MGNIKDVIEFLRLQRRYEEAEKNPQEPTDVQLSYLEEDGSYSADKTIFETDFVKFKRIVQMLEDNHAENIYLYETPSERKYFVKTQDGKLHNLLDQSIETLPVSGMAEFTIEFEYNKYIYDTEKNRVVILSETLKEVVVFPDTIYYSPDGEFLKDVDNDNYQYQYSDHTTFFAKVINFLFIDAKKVVYDSDKKVNFRKAEQPGKMRLIPFMDADLTYKNFILKYPYDQKDYRPKLRTPDEECAIILKFNSVGALLSFLNETLFSQGFDIETSDNPSRDPFREQFKNQIIKKVEDNVKTDVRLYYRDMMEILYYLPESVAVAISNDVLWMLVEEGIRRDSLTNKLKLAEEDIYIKLLETILQKEGQETVFIERLSEKILDGKKYASVLEYLYDRIHGENVVKFVNLVNRAWKKTRFIIPDIEKNPEYKSTDGPLILPYESEKWFGFYFSNAAASFETNKQKERILQIAYDTGEYETVMRPGLKTDRLVPTKVEIVDHFWYHPFYPIYIKNLDKQETEIKLDSIIPAFMLKANHDKQFWNNVITGAEYALDVATTLSGVGNIAKFRYLAKFATKASKLRFVSEAGRTVATARKIIAATAAVVEITSGSVNIMLKLSNLNNGKFGKALQEYLFWLELLSLSGELSVAIHNGLKKSAKEVLEHEDEIINELNKLDELDETNKLGFLDELKRISKEYISDISVVRIIPDLTKAAERKLYQNFKELFFKTYGDLLKGEFLFTNKVLMAWKKLDAMKALSRSDLDDLLAIRKRFEGPMASNNVAKVEVEVSINGKKEIIQYQAISGRTSNYDGFAQTPSVEYMAEQLNTTKNELKKLFQAKSPDNKRITNRFSDTEHKILAQFDDDMQKLYARYGKGNVEVHSFKYKSLYAPCNSCKKQILLRNSMYKPKKISFEAVQAGKNDFVETNKQLLDFIN